MPREDISRGGSGRAGVNKNFLLNTVHGLKSHNKREEEEDCWRQHDLEQRARERLLAHDANRNRRQVPADGGDTSASHVSDVDARRFWAERKERAMTATTPAIEPNAAAVATGGGGGSSPAVDRKRQREDSEAGAGRANGDRGDRRKREDKMKANKKKKKKRKRESRDRAGSDDERGADGVGTEGGDEEARRRQKRSKKRAQKKSKK
ncbi:unnamed protein product [Ectocarpus sp. 12 AP-2014]